jgi:4-hydroxy-tetrahydrodipicolinate reductase
MGATVCAAVAADAELELVAAVDQHAGGTVEGVTIAGEPKAFADAGAEVVVDFTVAAAARTTVPWLAMHGIHAVVGTTGLTDADLALFRGEFGGNGPNCVVAANFSISAVLMMRFAEMAAPWFETAEVVELHHDRKIDAPSGTAMLTAQRMAAASGTWGSDPTEKVVADGARGGKVGGVGVHSLRLRGVFAHQEVVLGTDGQTLTIRHDSYDRSAYMPGVLLAVREVAKRPGLTIGLDPLLGL